MDFNTYQQITRKDAKYPDIGNNFIFPTLGLVEEAGEVTGKIKKLIRNQNKFTPADLNEEDKSKVIIEMGDELWYLSALASELGVTLNEVAEKNLEKVADRVNRGVTQGAGDNR